jgi:hypothetical protein
MDLTVPVPVIEVVSTAHTEREATPIMASR